MAQLVPPRVRGIFRDHASVVVLRDIERIWQAEGFAPGSGNLLGAGQRASLWSDYEASVDWSDPGHARRVIRVYESFLAEFYPEGNERIERVLRLDRWAI